MGLVGKIHFTSDMSELELMDEVRSVFSEAMKSDDTFPFTFLQVTGSGSKTFAILSLSARFRWNAKQVVGLGGQGCIYILAERELPCEKTEVHTMFPHTVVFFLNCVRMHLA